MLLHTYTKSKRNNLKWFFLKVCFFFKETMVVLEAKVEAWPIFVFQTHPLKTTDLDFGAADPHLKINGLWLELHIAIKNASGWWNWSRIHTTV